jgi:DNA-binding SARP family transcriptional activator
MANDPLPKARFEPPAVRAIVRERVDRLFDRAWAVPLTIVVGPAGAGKTTAASRLLGRTAHPVIWYRAHPIDSDEAILCDHLGQAIAHATGETGEWTRLADLLVDIERRPRLPHLLVVDEFDAVIGTASERALSALLIDVGASIHFVTLSRHRPSLNVARLKLLYDVCEIGPDHLRFRSWEVDQLFRELYRRTLPPTEVAELERRSGGWVAALQLFNLATTGLAARERKAVLAHVGRRAGPDWDFLAENVLAGLPAELQRFMIETSPLPRLSAELCDELLGVLGSARTLAELERLQLVTASLEGPGVYRSHEVLRSHVEGLLVESKGADAVREVYCRAAEVLERHGQFAEALGGYCRGEDWPSASRLLGSRGSEVADKPGAWLATLPPNLVESDPWLLLAVARHQRADGRVAEAITTYRRVERTALGAVPVSVARRERLLLASLLDRSSPPSVGWVAALRDAACGGPLADADALGGRSTLELLAKGLVSLLRGEVRAAGPYLREARERPDASAVVSLVADLGFVVASALARTATPDDADDLERSALAVDVPFLGRISRAAAVMVRGSMSDIEAVVEDCERAEDHAGAAVAAVLGSLAAVWRPLPTPSGGNNALDRCETLGLRNLAVWVRVAAALAPAVQGDEQPAVEAEVAARRRGLRALERLAEIARRRGGGGGADQVAELTTNLFEDHGIALPSTDSHGPSDGRVAPASPDRDNEMEFRCFGRFSLLVDGRPVDLSSLRPRARAVLRMLAVNFGRGVHRQVLCDGLWPDDDEEGAAKKLQVAISSIRRVVEAHGAHDLVRRDADMYVLDKCPHVVCDVDRFTVAVAEARAWLASGDGANAEAALRTAVELYGGDLLSDDGAADWVVAERIQLQSAAVEMTRRLASLLLERGDLVSAIEVCRKGLECDRFSDPLWRLLLDALRADNDLAGHALAVSRYNAVLAELGVSRELAGSSA